MLATIGKYLLNARKYGPTGSIERRQPRMAQRPWQDASDPRVLEPQRPPRVNLKTRLLVVAERARMVESSRVHPEPFDRPDPGPVDRGLQQKRPELAADELRDQPEIG